jgi:alpha-L-fucosidase 2
MNPPPPPEVTWTTPSENSSGSMPLGNGRIGLNAWCEPTGQLRFYLSSTDAWDETGQLLKLGLVSLDLSPNPFDEAGPFTQTLRPEEGCIEITAGTGQALRIGLWVDANRPVVHVELTSQTPIEAAARLEIWRSEPRQREPGESAQAIGLTGPDQQEQLAADIVLDHPDALLWCHRNETSCWEANLTHQHLGELIATGQDPLLGRTFGGLIRGTGLVRASATQLTTDGPVCEAHLAIHPLTVQCDSLDTWTTALLAQADASDATPRDQAREEHRRWWKDFWQRSWIDIAGDDQAAIVTQGYALQRFLNACGGRGALPIKFNGSIFTVETSHQGQSFNADYRRWGGGYWFQNTRLLYWSMIASGDFDLMEPWLAMYRRALPLAIHRDRICFGLDAAAFFPETMTFWGTFLNNNYGYDRDDLPPGLSQNTYIRRYWQGGLELLSIVLDAWATSGEDRLITETLLPLAGPILRHYFGYYTRRDENGKVRFAPAQSLETWHEAVNPSPVIAGLGWVLDGLLALPEELLDEDFRQRCRSWRALLPELPTRTFDNWRKKVILPGAEVDHLRNSENPELYCIFPYRLYGLGKADLDVALATWEDRLFPGAEGWRQDPIQAAMLGLTDEARDGVCHLFSTPHEESRFPAFWGPNFDWVPDQDHGSVGCIALQRMLLQADDGRILLLPSWPKPWDVRFRLHAPQQTIVEGELIGGTLRSLTVTPEARRADVILPDWLS